MIRVIQTGCAGQMGRALAERIKAHPDMEIVAGMDISEYKSADFPVYRDLNDIKAEADIVIDFSHISLTPSLLDYCLARKLPLVLCTTGIAGELEARVKTAAESIPLFRSFNMSLGISLLQTLVRQATKVLWDTCDIEIIEKHHNRKVDAPSGTAVMIAQAAASALPYEPSYVYDRTLEHKRRDRKDIGVHSVRGGNIVGEHEIMFIGPHETLTISHSAQSRELFANGAVKAAEFLMTKKTPGLYNMDDLVASLT